ncbi:uncharacterized protein STEHIDRAFT_141331 [Stereum hirsutum FP-91666 SS1]|uniref:uncharacterized protein n=1 Tax=Stereum hirsutum (strain FP-91666) TaxID=721885 RepID=UPI000444A802|nr:uncharacterized protein STEHIDRAFT_141331 [Stereum hirsutum FP-91666 SS1]EIM82636.1 hypothetical protein STEHIDRAFT_141331 [Stereum hirsutum FP-91666 SS1]
MFRNVARTSLRRALHTSVPRANATVSRRGIALALATTSATAYFGWRIASGSQGIALDMENPASEKPSSSPKLSEPTTSTTPSTSSPPSSTPDAETTVEAIATEAESEEGESQGAFDPVTGKINWDCPCLGGMAYGPCGMQFREAFSCFVFSEDEPKGINCVDKFKAMQNCFRENPEVYGEEIMNDDDDDEQDATTPSSADTPTSADTTPASLAAQVDSPSAATAEKATAISSTATSS